MSPEQKPSREDVNSTKTDRKGLGGAIELAMRRFKAGFHFAIMLPLYLGSGAIYGVALIPAAFFYQEVRALTAALPEAVQVAAACIAIGMGFFLWGFALIVILPILNAIFCRGVGPWRGPYYSLPAIKWFIHNGLVYLVRYPFLEFITPGPFLHFFYRAMGMKIGPGAQLNSTHISDPALIEIGAHATVGGSVTLVGHYGMAGYLIIAPTKIGKGAVVGLRAVVMADVEIGDGAKVLPNSVVLPKTRIPAGETWGGVPAVRVQDVVTAPEPERV